MSHHAFHLDTYPLFFLELAKYPNFPVILGKTLVLHLPKSPFLLTTTLENIRTQPMRQIISVIMQSLMSVLYIEIVFL